MTDCNDLVIWFKKSGLVGRPCWDQRYHLGVFIFELKNCANALQRETHIDIEVLGCARRKVLGMRVVGFSEGVHVELVHILTVSLACPGQPVGESLHQQFMDFVYFLVGHLQIQDCVLDSLPPELIQFSFCRGPGCIFTINQQCLCLSEIKLIDAVLQHRNHFLEAIDHPDVISIKNIECRIEVATPQSVVHNEPILLELVDILLQKIAARRVEICQVDVEDA